MRYLIIGLGIYGANLAMDLTDMGHEVIGADSNPNLVDNIKDKISTAYIIDSTDEAALAVLPLKSVDLVIVAIGENFGASIKTVALLKKLGVKCIYARAVDDIHETILRGFQVDRILIPEQRAATELTYELVLGSKIDALRIDALHYVIKFEVPDIFVGMTVEKLDLDNRFGIRLIGLLRMTEIHNILGISTTELTLVDDISNDTMLKKGDYLTILCTKRQLRALMSHQIS